MEDLSLGDRNTIINLYYIYMRAPPPPPPHHFEVSYAVDWMFKSKNSVLTGL